MGDKNHHKWCGDCGLQIRRRGRKVAWRAKYKKAPILWGLLSKECAESCKGLFFAWSFFFLLFLRFFFLLGFSWLSRCRGSCCYGCNCCRFYSLVYVYVFQGCDKDLGTGLVNLSASCL